MGACNVTLSDSDITEEKLAIGLTFHQLGLIICVVFSLYSSLVTFFLIVAHGLHYSQPREQKQIIRIVFMIPIYSWISFLSFLFYHYAIYFQVIRDCYEALAIAAFFTLMCSYLAPTVHDQKDYFRSITPKNWILPLNWFQKCTGGEHKGPFRKPMNGLTWFNIMWIGVYQYCGVHVLMTFVSLITEAAGRYCEMSLSPEFGHVWVSVINAIGVTIAMYCLIQFYYQIKQDIGDKQPVLKLVSIKLVIFFSFWQNLVISFASTRVKTTGKLSFNDIRVGIPATLLCIEMAIFATMHLWAFSWRPFSFKGKNLLNLPADSFAGDRPKYQGGPLGIYAYWDAINLWDMVKAFARGIRWLFVGVRHRHEDISYHRGPDTVYSSTKLGPVGAGGPKPLQRDAHMSLEAVDRERHSRENPYDPGARPDFSAPGGDLGYEGNKVYYGNELPPAPIPHYDNPFGDASSYTSRAPSSTNTGRTPGQEAQDPFEDQHGLLPRPRNQGSGAHYGQVRDRSPGY